MTSDSEFIALVYHAIQLALDLTTYSNIWAVFSILLETQDVNMSYVQVMQDYYNQCYNTRTEEYMVALEKAAEQLKNNMYNNTLDGVSAYVQQSMCDPPVQSTDQHDKGKPKPQQQPKPPPTPPEQEKQYEDVNNYYHNENYRGNNRDSRPYRGQYSSRKPYRGS